MKWGVHKSQGTRDFYAKNPTSKQRSAEIDRARASVEKTRTAYKSQKRGTEERVALKDIHFKNPDLATSARLKRGEKVVFGLLAAQGYIPPVALGVQAGLAVRVGRRRAIEK
jgi:hypothetical protein